MSSFRSFIWDPTLLISQIICMQTVFYTIECISLLIYGNVSSYEPSLAHIFPMQIQRMMVINQLIASIGCAIVLSILVQRAKQCLDFSCTLHMFHILFTCIYNLNIPTQILWWVLQVASAAICTVLGEYLCMKNESKEIILGAPSKYDL